MAKPTAPVLSLLLVTALVAAAGCIDQGADHAGQQAPEHNPRLPTPGPVVYTCAGEAGGQSDQGVCRDLITSQEQAYGEPYIAIQPGDPTIRAIGANTGQTTGTATADGTQVTTNLQDIAILVTQDGGETWDHVELPPVPLSPPAPARSLADPALAFEADGTLHVTGLVVAPMPGAAMGTRVEVFHAATEDLGQSWQGPTTITDDGDNDRNWVTVHDGSVYVTWQVPSRSSSELAWSTDGGETWERITDEEALEDCAYITRVVPYKGTLLVSCIDAETDETIVHTFDPAAGALTEIGRIEARPTEPGFSTSRTYLHSLPNGSLAAVDSNGYAARSDDEGRTWTTPTSILGLTDEVEPTQAAHRVWSSGTGPDGGLHIVFADFESYDEPRDVYHILVDPADMHLVQETRLPAAPPDGAPGDKRHPQGSGEFNGMARTPDGMVLTWTAGEAIALTHAVPQNSSGR